MVIRLVKFIPQGLDMKIMALAASIILTFSGAAYAQLSERELTELTTVFIEAKNARQQPDTEIENIDHFLSLLAEPFVDEHVSYGVVITDRAGLREGMIAKMQDDILASEITIEQIMVGYNVAFVKFTERVTLRRSPEEDYFNYVGTTIISLEFNENGLIKHIRRHND